MMTEQRFYNSVAKAITAKREWWKLYEGKRFLNLNEPEDGSFDILRVLYNPTTPQSVCKEDRYEIIYVSKILSVSTASVGYFPSLKYIGKAKHKVVKI